ncbi:MAG: DNA-deoxyinosine glycosylase [Methylovulum sp.]|uniref:DNA-deoxyinosine glycosylase n=1 Tax=Methylovulum sp. TaxID=1916980 RepID=UPI00260E967B|nr:DNA-deoxyinosine glycosylase [Methylovulum sp.]MDD2724731.1 DNA-deoxyinosine glycosylase [Methylovulum sp.]MDD5124742.1 DNA-deoxyinosine glycosylase [Methylovulum sp.]
MSINEGFQPIADEKASVLILGSMPSVASLQAKQYYAHPRNAFWMIMGELFGANPELDYQQRQKLLMVHHIAVWDVLQSGYRCGSLDANIDMKSIQVNDFAGFYTHHPAISLVFFNGGMAEKMYRQRVLPKLVQEFNHLRYQRLPSTSPAHASLTLPQKMVAWQVIKQAT